MLESSAYPIKDWVQKEILKTPSGLIELREEKGCFGSCFFVLFCS